MITGSFFILMMWVFFILGLVSMNLSSRENISEARSNIDEGLGKFFYVFGIILGIIGCIIG